MNVSRTALFRFLFVALALPSSGALRAGSFTLDPRSPSWPDSNDILRDEPGPLAALPRLGVSSTTLGLQAFDWINALSDGRDPIDQDGNPGQMILIFSVTRGSAGLAGTGVEQEKTADTPAPAGGNPNGHAADLFTWDGTIGMNSLAGANLGWAGGGAAADAGDESYCHLRIPNTNHKGDNVDAYDRATMRVFNPADGWDQDNPDNPDNPWGGGGGGGVFPPFPIFFSLHSGSATLAAIGASPGDILAVGGSFGPSPVVFVSHVRLGIPANADLDALNLEVRQNAAGNLVPHRVRFSVRSATAGFALAGGVVVASGADILYYDGATTTVAHTANDLGLRGEDDLNALESEVISLFDVVPGLPGLPVPVDPVAADFPLLIED